MIRILGALGLGLVFSVSVQAREMKIRVETNTYPSPAAVHLDHIQRALAREAVRACGPTGWPDKTADIGIQISPALADGSVGGVEQEESGPEMSLGYVKIVATATISCKHAW